MPASSSMMAMYDPELAVHSAPQCTTSQRITISRVIASLVGIVAIFSLTSSASMGLWLRTTTNTHHRPIIAPGATGRPTMVPEAKVIDAPVGGHPQGNTVASLGAGFAQLMASGPALAATSEAAAWDWSWVGDLGLFTAKVFIAVGLPAAIVGFFIFKAVSGRPDRMSGDLDQGSGPSFFNLRKPGPRGAPKEYLLVERLNERLRSYRYSLQKALEGPEAALAGARRVDLARRFGAELANGLTDSQLEKISKAEAQWSKQRAAAQAKLEGLAASLRAVAAQQSGPTGTEEEPSGMGRMKMDMERKKLNDKLQSALDEQLEAELQYIQAISKVLKPEQRATFQKLLKTSPQLLLPADGPLVPQESAAAAKHVFVLKFFGDIQAQQVKQLRQEVTAILGSARIERGDEVVVILNSGGGTVTGYGLAAAQLMRLKQKGLKLTICVEEVAASGGYMMACTADRLVASPFAVLGSIGVITEQPNIYERLRREGINWTTTTAGKYKRTLTPFKEPTAEDRAKAKEDIEAIFALFRTFVKSNRPVLDIEKVATGETWFGQDALERRLCDELKTSDDVLLEFLDQGAELFGVTFKPPPAGPLAQLLPAAAYESGSWRTALAELLLGQSVAPLPRGPMALPADDITKYRFQAQEPLPQLRDTQYAPLQYDDWEFL